MLADRPTDIVTYKAAIAAKNSSSTMLSIKCCNTLKTPEKLKPWNYNTSNMPWSGLRNWSRKKAYLFRTICFRKSHQVNLSHWANLFQDHLFAVNVRDRIFSMMPGNQPTNADIATQPNEVVLLGRDCIQQWKISWYMCSLIYFSPEVLKDLHLFSKQLPL